MSAGAAHDLRHLLGRRPRACRFGCCWGGAPPPLYPMSRKAVRAIREALRRQRDRLRAGHARARRCTVTTRSSSSWTTSWHSSVASTSPTSPATVSTDRAIHRAEASAGTMSRTLLRGPASAPSRHFNLRWKEAAGEPLPAPEPGRGVTRSCRSCARCRSASTTRCRGAILILGSYAGALRSAEHLVYLENQFLWSAEIVEILREKLCNPPSDRFRLLVVLPAKPNSGARRHHRTARPARGRRRRRRPDARLYALCGGGRLVRSRLRARQGGIVDDRWLTSDRRT